MIFGITTFTLIHTLLSLVAIITGFVVVGGWIGGKQLEGWSRLFLATTILTNVTGFGFPFVQLLPGHIIGAISLLLLPVVIWAFYGSHAHGPWRRTYLIGALVSLWFNVFILVVQLFKRIPGLIAAAPTQKEPPFAVAQLVVLILFAWLGRQAVQGMRTT